VGCGTGRILLHFAAKGYWAVGVDLSEEMLRIAGEKAAAAGLSVPLVRANAVELGCLADGSFDYAACLFSTVGMVSGAGNRLSVVRHVCRLLRPGGTFVLHVHNRWFSLWDRAGRRWLLGEAARGLLRRGETGDRHMPAHQGLAGLTLHHFTRREAVRLLRQAGFGVVEVRPVGAGGNGRVRRPWWFGWARAYGYLIAARRG
jgi:ubiquinone/menaquinone biosynthesis C-methylase UbiE